jgi:hypothetical protein
MNIFDRESAEMMLIFRERNFYRDLCADLLDAVQEILKDAELAGEKTSACDIDFHLETIRETARTAINQAKGESK